MVHGPFNRRPFPARTVRPVDVMTTPSAFDPGAPPIEGYDEDTIDDFLRAVREEQSRLEAEIADAHAREARALALLGMHEAMVVTMHDVYRDVTARRRAAEATAAATMDDARRRVSQLRGGSDARTRGEVV